MYISLYETIPFLKDFLLKEKPQNVLMVSLDTSKYVKMIRYILNAPQMKIDKIDVNHSFESDFPGQKIYSMECLDDASMIQRYDMVFIADLFEHFDSDVALDILKVLLNKVNKSLFLLLPELIQESSANGFIERRTYHPTFLREFDFSYITCPTIYGAVQMYSFFPAKNRNLKGYSQLQITPLEANRRKIKVGYFLPHKKLTGGLKCLLEQMRQLHRRGHAVYAIYEGVETDTAIPAWSDVILGTDIDGELIVSKEQDISNIASVVDVVILGWYKQIVQYFDKLKMPIVYWEQGYEEFYGDYKQLLASDNTFLEFCRAVYRMPIHFLAVSDIVSEVLYYKYNVESHILYNGIDLNSYYPMNHKNYNGTILLVGNPVIPLKNFAFAIDVLIEAWNLGYRFNVRWACQVRPNIQELPFPIEYYVMVSQQELSQLYRTSDIFMFTSVYESFPMPPIEAMASGVPVIATDCGGIRTYGRPNDNLLLVNQGDKFAFVNALAFLLTDEKAREMLSKNGLETAKEYQFSKVIANLENYLLAITSFEDK